MGTNENNDDLIGATGKTLLDKAKSAINKAAGEALVNKAKDILKRQAEHQRAANLCDEELKKLIADHEAGLL